MLYPPVLLGSVKNKVWEFKSKEFLCVFEVDVWKTWLQLLKKAVEVSPVCDMQLHGTNIFAQEKVCANWFVLIDLCMYKWVCLCVDRPVYTNRKNWKQHYKWTTAFEKCKCVFLWCIYNRLLICLLFICPYSSCTSARSNTFYWTSW